MVPVITGPGTDMVLELYLYGSDLRGNFFYEINVCYVGLVGEEMAKIANSHPLGSTPGNKF